MARSHYQIPAEIRDRDKIKFAHIECCSVEEIKRNLVSQAESQIRLYQDVIDMLNEPSLEKIRDFEMKYGTYEEISQGQHIDHHLMVSALVSELKKKVAPR